MTDWAILDLETTGLFPRSDRAIEVGIVRMSPERSVRERYETLLNPSRDVGPTNIHGISASDVLAAPTFGKVAARVFDLLADAVIIGHNVKFDLGFLASEARREGWILPPAPVLDTINLTALAGFQGEGRSLAACCRSAGIAAPEEHRALRDAEATAALLVRCWDAAPALVAPLFELTGAPRDLWPEAAPAAPAVCRDAAHKIAVGRRESFLGRMIERLPGELVCDENDGVTAYYALLDRALEDRRVEEHEAEALLELAADWGLERQDVHRAHRSYLDALFCAALRDGVLSAGERDDLFSVGRLLGFDPASLERRLEVAAQALSPLRSEAAREVLGASTLAGASVCFTGTSSGRYAGRPITRELAESLAERAGLEVTKGVTRTTKILVVADLDTSSGKARKARENGVRLMVESEFWRALGLPVEC